MTDPKYLYEKALLQREVWEELDNVAKRARRLYQEFWKDFSDQMGLNHYDLRPGDVVEYQKPWGYKGKTRTTRVMVESFGAYKPTSQNFNIQGRIVRKDGTLGEQRETIYTTRDGTVAEKITLIGYMEDGELKEYETKAA